MEQADAAGRTLKVQAALKRRVEAQLDLLKDLTPCASHTGFTFYMVIFASERRAPWEYHGIEGLESGFYFQTRSSTWPAAVSCVQRRCGLFLRDKKAVVGIVDVSFVEK